MALRDAAVRLTLNAGGFAGGLRTLAKDAERVGKQMGRAMNEPMKAGFKAARGAAGELMNDIKGALKAAATLGGSVSVGAGIKNALQMTSVYKNLAFEMTMATGKAVTWQTVQKDVEGAALATSRSSEEMAAAFKSVKDETGDIALATASMRAIGVAANVSGKGTQELAGVVGALNDKFGVTSKEMPDMLAAMLEFSTRGGLSFEDLTKAIHLMGGSARAAGYMGADGVRRMIAMANLGGDALGSTKKGLAAIQSITDKMADPAMGKEIKKTFGVDVKDKSGNVRDMTDVLAGIMAKTRGKRAELAKVFKGEELKLVTEVGKYFTKGFEGATGSDKDKTRAGEEAFRRALEEAGNTTTTFATLEEENAKRLEDPQVKLQKAMEIFYQSLTKPEMLDAMGELSKSLPKLAEGLGKLVEFATKHPVLAGGIYAGGKVGGAAVGSVGGALPNLVIGGGKALGTEIAQSFSAQVAAQGKWGAIGTNVGAAAAIAIAAGLAYELGKYGIDQISETGDEVGKGEFASDISADALLRKIDRQRGVTPEDQKEAASLYEKLTHRKTLGEAVAGGPGFTAGLLDQLSMNFGDLPNMLYQSSADSSSGAGTDEGARQREETIAALAQLGGVARDVAAEFKKIKAPGGGSHGLPPQPPKNFVEE